MENLRYGINRTARKKIFSNHTIKSLRNLSNDLNKEDKHDMADECLCKLLTDLGFLDVVEEYYKKIGKLYAKYQRHC